MATDPDFIEYVHEQSGLAGRLEHRRMFGEYGIYLDGKVVAFACDNTLFLKPTDAGRRLLPAVVEGGPYPGAKPHFVLNEFLDDSDLFRRLLEATAAALPAPEPKTPGKTARKATNKPTGRSRGR